MRHDEVISALAEMKYTGGWQEICRLTKMRPDTLSRIARRDIPNPGVKSVEAIADAIRAMKWTKSRELADEDKAALREATAALGDDATLDQLPRHLVPARLPISHN